MVNRCVYRKSLKLFPHDFVFPEERQYPIIDIGHAKGAILRVNKFGTEEEKKLVTQEVYKRFPSLKP
jgi:hypothetical protein